MFDWPASTQRSPTKTLPTAAVSTWSPTLTWQTIVYGPPTGTPTSLDSAWLNADPGIA